MREIWKSEVVESQEGKTTERWFHSAMNYILPFTLQMNISEASFVFTQEKLHVNGINRTCLWYISIPSTWYPRTQKYCAALVQRSLPHPSLSATVVIHRSWEYERYKHCDPCRSKQPRTRDAYDILPSLTSWIISSGRAKFFSILGNGRISDSCWERKERSLWMTLVTNLTWI